MNPVGVELWYLLNPPEGAGTATVTLSEAKHSVAGSVSFGGVDQSSTFGPAATSGGQSTDISTSAGTYTSEVLLDLWAKVGTTGDHTPGGTQTQLWEKRTDTASNDDNDVPGGMSYAEPGGTSYAMAWTSGYNKTWAHLVVPLRAPAESPTSGSVQGWEAAAHKHASAHPHAVTRVDRAAGPDTSAMTPWAT